MTSRIRSFGWSWWTPWMMKCSRRPSGWSGSKWKTRRCSQYSVSVQKTMPPRTQSTAGPSPARSIPKPSSTPMTGTKTMTGTLGCTRESLSSTGFSNMRGEDLRRSLRRTVASWVDMALLRVTRAALSSQVRGVLANHHDLVAGDGQEVVPLEPARAVEEDQLDVGQGDEIPVGRVEIVGDPAAVAVPGE